MAYLFGMGGTTMEFCTPAKVKGSRPTGKDGRAIGHSVHEKVFHTYIDWY
jgi:hypothetical protein